MKINIVHMFPDLLNQYGDKGNILTLKKRIEDRGIQCCIEDYTEGREDILSYADIIYIGGGTERANITAYNSLLKIKDEIKAFVQEGKVILSVCGGYEMLGKSFECGGKTYKGLGITQTVATSGKKRLIGNIITESEKLGFDIVGFENHTGRVDIGNHTPLGIVKYGIGNTEAKDTEGIIYKNLIGTYIHGPVLPKNPLLADYIIECALKNKDEDISISKLDDTLEDKAHNYIKERFLKNR